MRLRIPLLFALCVLGGVVAAERALPDWRKDPPGGGPAAASPSSYPDAEGFASRAALVVENLAQEDLRRWRTGFFAGGDPGRYLPPAAMAKLLLDPEDAMAREHLNDRRSPTEHDAGAAVNWARLLPLFPQALAPATRREFATRAAGASYLTGGGSETQVVMLRSAALVLAEQLDHERFSGLPRAAARAEVKSWLKRWVKALYAAGPVDWDCPQHLVFVINSLLNIYDFSSDGDCRLLARAGLDRLVAAYALKYTDAVHAGPHLRGSAAGRWSALTDQTGWLWWGADASPSPAQAAEFRHTIHAQTSAWRPNQVLTSLARKRLPALPVEHRAIKAAADTGRVPADVVQGVASAGWNETLYTSASFTLGSLGRIASGGPVPSDRFQLAVRSTQGTLTFTAGTSLADDDGRYDQTAQIGSALVRLVRLPSDTAYAYVALPASLVADAPPVLDGGWWILKAGRAWIGIRGLGAPGSVGEHEIPGSARGASVPALRFPGKTGGFALIVGEAAYADRAAFVAALGQTGLNGSDGVAFTGLDGKSVTVRWQESGSEPAVTHDGGARAAMQGPIAGPLIRCEASVLSVSDGKDGYQIDFSGDLPIYR